MLALAAPVCACLEGGNQARPAPCPSCMPLVQTEKRMVASGTTPRGAGPAISPYVLHNEKDLYCLCQRPFNKDATAYGVRGVWGGGCW